VDGITGSIIDKAPYAGIPYNEIVHYFYADLYGRVTAYSEGGAGNADVSWEWNNAFQQTAVTARTFSVNAFPNPGVRETAMTYDTVFDGEGNVVEPGQGNALSSAVTYGAQTDTTTLTYYNESKYHQMATATDPLNRTTQQEYFDKDDPNPGKRGNLWKVTDANNGVTEFDYNQYGQKASMKDAELRTWSYDYNAQGDLTKLTYPGGAFTQTTYDDIGRPTQVTDRKGQNTTIQYNAIGQPTTITYQADNTTVSYAYNADGQVTSVTDPRGTTTYTYDATTGNLLSVTDPVTGTVSYEYLPIGVRSKMTLPNGKFITYTYDFQAQGHNHNSQTINGCWRIYSSDPGDVNASFTPVLKEIVDGDGYKTAIAQLNNGAPDEVTADIAKNGQGQTTAQLKPVWSYDAKARLTRMKASSVNASGATYLIGYEYDYDQIDNRSHLYEIDENNTHTATESYGYDVLARLTSVTYKDSVTQSYTFDKVGNRLSKTEGTNTTNYTYNELNEMTAAGSDSYTYDQNGNTLTGGGRTYVWDQQNRMKLATKNGVTTTFTYRSDGLRASKTVNGVTTNYVYDGQTVVGETRSDGTSSWYTPGANGYLSRTDVDNQGNVVNKEWFVYDGLGSCRAIVKPNAQGDAAVIVARYDYDVYGAVRTQSGSSSNKFKYVGGSCGHPTDDETGLIYMRARYYDSVAGRFVSEDPALHGVNWYWYASANPISRVDVSGKVDAHLLELVGLGLIITAIIMMAVSFTKGEIWTTRAILYLGAAMIIAAVNGITGGHSIGGWLVNVVAGIVGVLASDAVGDVYVGMTAWLNRHNLQILNNLNKSAFTAGVAMVTYGTLAEIWIHLIDNF
jgi:RHS repeat-associated protein